MGPIIQVNTLPENEQEAAWSICTNLSSLQSCVDNLKHAIALYEFSEAELARKNSDPENRRMFRYWSSMVWRDATLTIYSAYMVMQAISQRLLHKAPTVMAHTDHNARSEAYKLFDDFFPGIGKLRLDVAHPNELASTPEKAKKNAVSDGFASPEMKAAEGVDVFMSGVNLGGSFTSTVDGQARSISLGPDCVAKLEAVVACFYKAFVPVSEFTAKLSRERLQRMSSPPTKH